MIPGLENLWKDARSIVNSEIAEKYENYFLRSTGLIRNRLMLLRRKYSFYKGVLRRDDKIMGKYGESMGEEMLEDRVLYAVSGCISDGKRLRGRLDESVLGFSIYCRRHESEDHFSLMIDPPASDCEIIGVCGCIGGKRPYMSSCVGDQTALFESQKVYDERLDRSVESFIGQVEEALAGNADLLYDLIEHY